MDNEQLKDEMEKWLMVMELRMTDKIKAAIFERIDKSETRLMDRIEAMEKRVIRQGGLLQGGSRTVYRLADWSEETDTELLRHASRIDALERQIAELKRERGQ